MIRNCPARESPLTIKTSKGDVDLPMLVGALLRSTEVKTIGQRPDCYDQAVREERRLRGLLDR